MVAARRVSMDTSFGPVFHITAPPTFGHQLPSSSVVDDFSFNFLSEEETLKTLVCVSPLKFLKKIFPSSPRFRRELFCDAKGKMLRLRTIGGV